MIGCRCTDSNVKVEQYSLPERLCYEKSFSHVLNVVTIYRKRTGYQIRKVLKRPKQDLGGYSSEVPPLPIPNREVKLTNADGTAVFPWESR